MAINLVANGGFETGDISGWTATGNTNNQGIDFDANSGSFAYYSGTARSDGFLGQTVATIAGAAYVYDFFLASGNGTPNDFSARLGSRIFIGVLHDAGPTGYVEYTGIVVAPSTNATLTFGFRQDPDFWQLDDVSLTEAPAAAVPEPASWALMAGGFGLAGAAARRGKVKFAS